jgi:hypothetical protein
MVPQELSDGRQATYVYISLVIGTEQAFAVLRSRNFTSSKKLAKSLRALHCHIIMPALHAEQRSVGATVSLGGPARQRRAGRVAPLHARRRTCVQATPPQVAGLDKLPSPGSADLVLHSPSKVRALTRSDTHLTDPSDRLCSLCPDQLVLARCETQRGWFPRLGVPLPRACARGV